MKKFTLFSCLCFSFLLTGCNFHPNVDQANIKITNVASEYCIEQGGKFAIHSQSQGDFNVCVFDDNSQCEEWAFYRGKCKKGEYFMNESAISENQNNSNNIEVNEPVSVPDVKKQISGNYLGSFYAENYVWGGAMNLAWNELNENILHEKLQLNTTDEKALDMVARLNDAPFAKNDFDKESYYIKSGYGQAIVDTINRESKEKFPSKSFTTLDIQLKPQDIISYAYFLKEVEYEIAFEEKNINFNGKSVKGFYADNKTQKKNIKILRYENDNKFIISLQLKDNSDELILAKGYDMTNQQGIVDKINEDKTKNFEIMGESDNFSAPIIHLDYHRDYIELLGKYLKNKGFEDYYIDQMFENIKFDMDEKGARVENEAVITQKSFGIVDVEEFRNFVLDKPYWVIMKRANSKNPYFLLGVNNTALMEEV